MASSTLIILHGWGSASRRWENVRAALEREGVQVVVPDLPGFGSAPPPDTAWGIEGYVQWVDKFCAPYGTFSLLGHSFGGRIASLYAARHPEKISLLFLSGTPIRPVKRAPWVRWGAALGKKFSFLPGFSLVRRFLYSRVLGVTDYLRVEGVMKEIFRNIIATDISGALSRMRVPTVLLWGTRDRVTPFSVAQEMEEAIERAELVPLEGKGHAPHLEDPESFAREILVRIRGG